MNRGFLGSFFICLCAIEINAARRIGKLNSQTWQEHLDFGSNGGFYVPSNDYPDLGVVGVLKSENGLVGTATLIAPNVIVSAAHVIKDSFSDPVPTENEWSFILSSDFEQAVSSEIYSVSGFVIHPTWLERQDLGINDGYGDGDKMGVDLCLGFLSEKVIGIYPSPLHDSKEEWIGQRVIIAGYGTWIDGLDGFYSSSKSNRMAGENILDRVVQEVVIDSISVDARGGLLAVDFDSPQQNTNYLGSEYENTDFLGTGSSDPIPLSLEISTAKGDSGGPLFTNKDGNWGVSGVVSYGTDNSSMYGDITVFTRLGNHLQWIQNYLPNWAQARILEGGSWRELDWFGAFLPFSSGWSFHQKIGWFFTTFSKSNEIWVWQEKLGWWWSSSVVFPYLYSNSRQSWLFLELESTNSSNFFIFDYSQNSWENLLL